MTTERARWSTSPWFWATVLALCWLVRLLTLPLLPLTDHTEARYAEIARLMLALGDWVSPHITPDEVFWAKPPLSTWGQALSMAVGGVNETAVRLPAALWGLGGLVAMAWMLRGSLGRVQILAVLVALSLCPLYFVSSGAAMTDATMGATVLWVQAAWWRCSRPGATGPWAGRVLALALALALLTKGPAAAVLALLPVLGHAAWHRHWGALGRVLRDPWCWAILLLLTVPWYALAEARTPGFLRYFLLGEHVMRFIDPGWKGDRYGFAHEQALGAVWLFALLAALPLCLAAAIGAVHLAWRGGAARVAQRTREALGGDLSAFAVCLALAPLLLFSASRNLIWTYAMTALPGMALLGVSLLDLRRGCWALAGAGLVAVYAAAFVFWLPGQAQGHSDKALWAAYLRDCGGADCSLNYPGKPAYSAFFYSAGALYHPDTPRPGSKPYEVVARGAVPPDGALACNLEHCLMHVARIKTP